MGESHVKMESDWSNKNIYFLTLITLAYIIGEIAHFLIATTSKEVANDVHYGDQICSDIDLDTNNETWIDSNITCSNFGEEITCLSHNETCEWIYNGQGTQFQILVGPAFIFTFATANLLFGLALDRFNRPLIMGTGVFLFSLCCMLMGVAQEFWQLVVLRIGIALGEAVCRPAASSLIAEKFGPQSRGVANGIFSWGIYFGYGLAFIYGRYLSKADILGFGWRAAYVIGGAPGIIIALAILFTIRETRTKSPEASEKKKENTESEDSSKYTLFTVLMTMFLLVCAAAVRQIAGLAWANNNTNYLEQYYPNQEIGFYWMTVCSICGGAVGVVSGGYITDQLQKKFGLHSRLWVQSAFFVVAVPFAVLTIYLAPPYCFIALALYYLFAETWFAILFTVIVELVPAKTRGVSAGFFIFVMNMIAGSLGVLVEQVGDAIGFREAMYLFFPGLIAVGAVLFFIASLPLYFISRSKTS